MIGISISLYDKFDDLAILVDIIRENWEEAYFISVCSNHPEAPKRIEELDLDIDSFVHGTQINYSPSMDGLREQVNRICRVYDTVKNAVEPAIHADEVSHVMHVHADAWPLSETEVHELIDEVRERDARTAFKGKGLGQRGHRLVGHMMDQFFILDANYAAQVDFFEHNPLELLPDRGIHTMMTILLLGKVGWSNVHFYSDQSEQIFWDGQPSTGARPMAYNPNREFLHLATEDFPNDLGKSLQACYLEEHDITEGEHVGNLLDKYHLPRETVVSRIQDVERRLNDEILFFDVADLGRNIRIARDYVDKSPTAKLQFLVQGGLNRLIKKLRSVDKHLDWLLGRNIPRVDPVARSGDFEGTYRSALRLEDFPEPYGDEQLEFFTQDE